LIIKFNATPIVYEASTIESEFVLTKQGKKPIQFDFAKSNQEAYKRFRQLKPEILLPNTEKSRVILIGELGKKLEPVKRDPPYKAYRFVLKHWYIKTPFYALTEAQLSDGAAASQGVKRRKLRVDDFYPVKSLIRRAGLTEVSLGNTSEQISMKNHVSCSALPKDWEEITDDAVVLDFGRKINPEVASDVLSELQREICPQHPLFGVECRPIAWNIATKRHFLFVKNNNAMPLVSVHFTWHEETCEGYPAFSAFADFEDFLRHEKRFHRA
jgi:hypothetical protein